MTSARFWLLALVAACLRFSSVESDHLPAALAELVNSGSVSSAEDLQLLLLSVSVDDDPESFHANNTTNRLPRSLLDAQPAQQALCKVRTEVMEVTRSMLDRSNANFLLWPPCVEVQRCSGCCNTKSLKCVPVLTHTRYLQVMKIQYSNMRPVYDKAIVSVNDHVECRCQPAPRHAPRKKSPGHKQEVREHTGKPRYKEDLHRRDELKHNQRLDLEDLLVHSWALREQHPDSDSDPGLGFLSSENLELQIEGSDWSSNKTLHRSSRGHYHGEERQPHNGTRVGFNKKLPNHTEKEEAEAGLTLHNVTKAEEAQREKELFPINKVDIEILKNTTLSGEMLTNQTLENRVSPTQTASQIPRPKSQHLHSQGAESRPATSAQINQNQNHNEPQVHGQAPNPTEGSSQKRGDSFSPTEESYEKQGRSNTQESGKSEESDVRRWSSFEEKEELLTHSQNQEDEKYKHLSDKQHSPHHKQVNAYTIPQNTETTSHTLMRAPRPHTPPRPPPRPPKRRRKQRNRISKAAMRAMLM